MNDSELTCSQHETWRLSPLQWSCQHTQVQDIPQNIFKSAICKRLPRIIKKYHYSFSWSHQFQITIMSNPSMALWLWVQVPASPLLCLMHPLWFVILFWATMNPSSPNLLICWSFLTTLMTSPTSQQIGALSQIYWILSDQYTMR